MGPPPYALSVSHFVSSVGADAGFAALIGLAVLILLYFAQARETASLRDSFAEASEHVRQLEQRIAHLARAAAPAPQAGTAPAPAAAAGQRRNVAAAAAPVAARSVAPASVPAKPAPAAPAFVGAPALAAATRLIPSGDSGAISIRPGGARSVAASAGGNGEREGGGAVLAPPSPAQPDQAPANPAPATAAGAANGVASPRGSAPGPPSGGPPPAPAARSGGPAAPRTGGQAAPPRPYKIAGARPPGATPPPRRPVAPPPERSRWRTALLIVAGLVAVGVIVVVLLAVTSSGTSSSRSSSSAAVSNAPNAARHRRGRKVALGPSAVTVAVLNGTSTTNLAHDVSLRLKGQGYKPGTIATATDQTQTATVVGYLAGQRRAALLVARSLNLGSASVQPVDQSNQAVACPQSTACPAQVVVTVGSDLAPAASSTTTAG